MNKVTQLMWLPPTANPEEAHRYATPHITMTVDEKHNTVNVEVWNLDGHRDADGRTSAQRLFEMRVFFDGARHVYWGDPKNEGYWFGGWCQDIEVLFVLFRDCYDWARTTLQNRGVHSHDFGEWSDSFRAVEGGTLYPWPDTLLFHGSMVPKEHSLHES